LHRDMRGILGRGNQQLIPTIKTHKMKKDEMLVARLDFLIPMNFFLSQEWQLMFGVDSKIAIGRVVELNRQWVIEVVNNLEHRLTDVLHDFKGIYAEDEHFLPRIQAEDILGDFDENGDVMEFTSAWTQGDSKINGYTNIETYRLCLVLDNTEYWKEDILQTFFRLVREDEFNGNDINIIDWNEVIKRYSDDLIETNIHHYNE